MIRNPPFGDPPLPAFQHTPEGGRTRLLERVPLERISEEARRARPGRTLLTVIAAVLFGAGFAAAKLAGTAWLAMAWTGAAVRVGWQEARGTALQQPELSVVLAENERLRLELARLGEARGPAGVS